MIRILLLAALLASTPAVAAPLCLDVGPYGCTRWGDTADLARALAICSRAGPHGAIYIDAHGIASAWSPEYQAACRVAMDRYENQSAVPTPRADDPGELAWLREWAK